jgi:hypothetical protein
MMPKLLRGGCQTLLSRMLENAASPLSLNRRFGAMLLNGLKSLGVSFASER